jgi:hypothetical protein
MGPRSPSSTATLLLHEAQVAQEVVGGIVGFQTGSRVCRSGTGMNSGRVVRGVDRSQISYGLDS